MQRYSSKFRSLSTFILRPSSSFPKPQQPLIHHHHHHQRPFHSNPFNKTLIHSPINHFQSLSITTPSSLLQLTKTNPNVSPSSSPLSFMQVRHLTLKQRKRKLKSRQPLSPVVSKLKKIKMKSYSSFKGRFRTMKDGQIRRWKEGKRHNAHLKSKIAKRRGRLPALVPAAYAKVMKKLNFCG